MEQLRSFSFLSGVVAGFAVAALLQLDFDVAETPHGLQLWFATSAGITVSNLRSTYFIHLSLPSSLLMSSDKKYISAFIRGLQSIPQCRSHQVIVGDCHAAGPLYNSRHLLHSGCIWETDYTGFQSCDNIFCPRRQLARP